MEFLADCFENAVTSYRILNSNFQSFYYLILPDEWQYGKVIPIHKHGKPNYTENYPPISIIPVVAKVFERIIYNQLSLFFSENRLLTTVTVSRDFVDYILLSLAFLGPPMSGLIISIPEKLMQLCF